MKYPRNVKLLPLARQMRRNMTKEERKLWYNCLRYCEPRFRRQEIIGSYIADFFCYEAAVIVELDGSQHYDPTTVLRDKQRSAYFSSLGITVLRYSNLDILHNFDGICQDIKKHLAILGVDLQFHFPD